MEYLTDEQGQIKVIDEKGNFKFLPKNLVDDLQLMRRNKFTPVPKPQIFEGQSNEENVAESAPAKRGRPSLK